MTEETLEVIKGRIQEIRFGRINGKHILYLDGAVQFLEGIDERTYHHALAAVPARMLGRSFRALILGGGDGLAARSLFEVPGCRGVTMVEYDPEMVKFCSENPEMRRMNKDSFQNPRLELIVGDARKFIERPPLRLYDLAIMDFPDLDEQGTFDDLYMTPFYRKMVRHIDGLSAIVSVQSSDDEDATLHKAVAENLAEATRHPSRTVKFLGDEIIGGYIVYGGRGANAALPRRTALDRRIRAV